MKNLKLALGITFAFIVITLVQGCARQPLVPLQNLIITKVGEVTVEADFCTSPASEYRQRLKYIFVMDKSSSNQDPPDVTDPAGWRRYAPLVNFIHASIDDPGYTFYSLVNFATTSAVVQDFTDDRAAFERVVNNQWNALGVHKPSDSGYTNYVSALTAIKNLIETDAKLTAAAADSNNVTTIYQIVFISDGQPVIVDTSSPTGLATQPVDDIEAGLRAVTALKDDPRYSTVVDSIIFHTGYYFQNRDSDAQSLLARLAGDAGGNAYIFGAGINIDYTLFAVPVRNVRHLFSDLLIENNSITWWDDGRLLQDTDSDGLPDEIELKLGSDPFNGDSDGNGVSDYVEYRTKGRPCKDSNCSPLVNLRDNYAICTGLLPPTLPDGSPNPASDGINVAPFGRNYFADSDKDGLNDCEEMVLGSDRRNFDSNDDGIPDFLSMKNQLAFIRGYNFASADPDADGVANYDEIKRGTPIFDMNNKIGSLKQMQFDVVRMPSTNGLDCFRAHVRHIAAIGLANLIKVYLVEDTSVIDNKKTLRVAEARADSGSVLRFSNGDFR